LRYLNLLTIILILGLVLTGCFGKQENQPTSGENLVERNTDELLLSEQDSDELTNESNAPPLETLTQTEFEAKLDQFMGNLNFSGSVLLAKDNRVIVAKGYGTADYTNKEPNGPDTIYQVGSLTKAFTAAAILQLQEAGKLSIHDPVIKCYKIHKGLPE
jgi:CubicO group peptidase (beta-lactamase class C family)